MLRFDVYHDSRPASDWPVDGAYLVGPDDLAIPGRVAFRSGRIECKKRVGHAVGLCLQHDADSMGRLMLQTCLLPDREQPYLLSLELARHRIKTYIAKCEEWQLFGLREDHPATQAWQTAREIFATALTAEDPARSDELARRALALAIEATERLALAHAELLLHWRYGNRPASSTTLGLRMESKAKAPRLRELVDRDFDLIVIPFRWNQIEFEEGQYNWDMVDSLLQWAQEQEKPFVLGPLLDFSKRSLPQWMYVWQHDYSTFRDLAYEFVERVVQRYRSAVGLWNIASGVNVNDNFQFTAEQMVDLVRMASLVVRQSRKSARTMIELVQPFGEYVATRRNAVAPLAFVDQIIQEGIPLNCIGVQLMFGASGNGRATRDLMQVSSLLDRFLFLDMPVLITAMGVPSDNGEAAAGWWHGRWSPSVQSRWVSRVFAIAMSKPYVETVVWSDLVDHPEAVLPGGGLVSATGKPKPVLQRLVNMRKRLRKPLGESRVIDVHLRS